MKENRENSRGGFTLVEILTVIAIISILVSILVPLAGRAKETALKRRAALEMQSIKVAAMQFHDDHHYMPWPTNATTKARVGDDMWTTDDPATQAPVMDLLTTNNAMKKLYLQIPEKSQLKVGPSIAFVDPWGSPYQIGMDRNMDGQVEVHVIKKHPDDQETPEWNNNKKVMEKVLVYSPGPTNSTARPAPLKTFDVPN